MKIKELTNYLEMRFPLDIKEEWDNIGLLIGSRDSEITKVLISLDITEKVIDRAIEIGANLILTHHPLIFSPIKSITGDTTLGKKILRLIENRILVYTMHTNLDSGRFGLNDFLGESILGFKNGKILDKNEKNGIEYGIGRVYNMENKITLVELVEDIKKRLNIEKIDIVAKDKNKIIQKVALISGAGSSYWREAKKQGADILITGDIRYHEAVDVSESDFILMDIGHFESEEIFTKHIKDIILEKYEIEIFEFSDGPIIERV